MARHPRLDLPGIPRHIVQRGNNRLPCFLDDTDRRRYLTLLREALLDSDCALHAYVLMDNHVHMLVTPPRPSYLSLGKSPAERASAYRALLDDALPADDIREIRIYLQQQRAPGRSDFQAMVAAKTRRFARVRPAHRPPKPTGT